MNVQSTALEGVFLIELDTVSDERGSFREAWQAQKMQALGLPPFIPVQQNISTSLQGVIRGIHAEPWEKYIHVISGKAFAAIVDLRSHSTDFAKVATFKLHPGVALFIPRGMGNSFQATTGLVYSYLVNEHWQPGVFYPMIAYNDVDLAIPWPLPAETHIISEKDRNHPTLRVVYPYHFQP